MFVKKKACGAELINEVMDRFTDMIDELEKGENDCKCEQTSIESQREVLRCREAVLEISINRATKIASNLRKLIGK